MDESAIEVFKMIEADIKEILENVDHLSKQELVDNLVTLHENVEDSLWRYEFED